MHPAQPRLELEPDFLGRNQHFLRDSLSLKVRQRIYVEYKGFKMYNKA